MDDQRDPVASAARDDADLYGIATWEERTSVDGLATAIYRVLVGSARFAILLAAFLILLAIGGLSALTDPQVGVLTALSALPALGLAGYVYYTDVTRGEPLRLLVGTFLLAVLTANFAAVINSVLQGPFQSIGFGGMVLFFFVVVGPVEEAVKLLAVRLYAYRSSHFHAVVDGAVYGAVAGLGFATIENSLYITQQLGDTSLAGGAIIGAGGGITAIRALAGPGHVIYSAIAGYYLGLAKFNRENAGPIIVKGILIAALVHATYNSTVGIGSGLIAAFTPLSGFSAFIAFVVVYDGVFAYYLLRKLRRYTNAYRETRDGVDERGLKPELTEFVAATPFGERTPHSGDGGVSEESEDRGGSPPGADDASGPDAGDGGDGDVEFGGDRGGRAVEDSGGDGRNGE